MKTKFVPTHAMRAEDRIDLFMIGMGFGFVIGFVLGVAAVLLWAFAR